MHSFSRIAAAWLACLAALLVLDVAWLMLVAVGQFQRTIGPLLRPDPDFAAAAALYPILAAALVRLAVLPALDRSSLPKALLDGAILGLAAYATFDLTSLAILKGYTFGLAALDIGWGTVLCAVASAAGYIAGARFVAASPSGSR